jgi:hypothetical protein
MHQLRHQEIDQLEVHEDDEEVVIDEEEQVLEDVDHDEVGDKNEFVLNSIKKSLVSVE